MEAHLAPFFSLLKTIGVGVGVIGIGYLVAFLILQNKVRDRKALKLYSELLRIFVIFVMIMFFWIVGSHR